MNRRFVMISGWAHAPSVFDPLCALLGPGRDLTATMPPELASEPGGTDYAEGLSAVLRESPQAPVLLGWSMGGMIALETVLRKEVQAAGLVLLASTARFVSNEDYTAGIPPRNLRAMIHGLSRKPESTLDAFLELAAAPFPPLLPLGIQRLPALAWGEEALRAGLEYLLDTDLRRDLASLDIPVLLLLGDEDHVIPPEASEYLANALPHCTLVTISGAGHDLPARFAEAVANQARSFEEKLV